MEMKLESKSKILNEILERELQKENFDKCSEYCKISESNPEASRNV